MKIIIKKLTIVNFKGIKRMEIDFDPDVTTIAGKNASGKTTVFDSCQWLFFGKDSSDRKDFNVKTLNSKGFPVEKQEVDVSGSFETTNGPLTLRRVFREKWVKKQGSKVAEFTGNETLYFWNDVPCSQAEFNAKVSSLIDENLFKLITNSLYFNSLPWKKRREVLFELAGSLSDADIIDSLQGDYANLLNVLNSGKSIEEYKREISAKKKKVKDELDLIPTRIDEINRNLPEEKDFQTIEVSIDQYKAGINDIDTSIHNASEAHNKEFEAIKTKQDEVNKLKLRQNEVRHEVQRARDNKANELKSKKSELTDSVAEIEANLKSKTTLLESRTTQKEGLTLRVNNLRELWATTNAKQFEFDEDSDFEFSGALSVLCDDCKTKIQNLDVDKKKEQAFKSFQDEKSSSLRLIESQGTNLNKEVEECDTMTATLEKAITALKEDLFLAKEALNVFTVSNVEDTKTLDEVLASHDEYLKLGSQVVSLQAEIKTPEPIDLSSFKTKKVEMNQRIDELKAQLADKETISRSKKRIEELSNQEQDLAQQLADFEGIEFTIDDFNRAKIDTIEAKINGKFKYVTFKLFDRQINGGEVECCDTLVNGIPHGDVNNAAKINAGLDIINALCAHYGVSAPIFCDNAESVNELIHTDSQLIRLVVTNDETLTVEINN